MPKSPVWRVGRGTWATTVSRNDGALVAWVGSTGTEEQLVATQVGPAGPGKKALRITATKPEAPGVVAVLLAEDVPGQNMIGPVRHDEPLFATEEISFHGQVVALVVGTSLRACRAAASLVEVDYEPLTPILTIAEAVAQKSFHTEPHALTRGDCAEKLRTAPARIDGEFELGGQEHFYLEICCVLRFVKYDKCIVECTATHIGEWCNFNCTCAHIIAQLVGRYHIIQCII